jgi:DNA-binding MarR family transcriptional regulator
MPMYHRKDAPAGKLTPGIISAIRRVYLSRELSQRQIAEMFGIHQSTVSRAVNDLTYNYFEET